MERNSLRRKSEATVNLKTGRFDDIDLAVIISSVSKAVQNLKIYDLQFQLPVTSVLRFTEHGFIFPT